MSLVVFLNRQNSYIDKINVCLYRKKWLKGICFETLIWQICLPYILILWHKSKKRQFILKIVFMCFSNRGQIVILIIIQTLMLRPAFVSKTWRQAPLKCFSLTVVHLSCMRHRSLRPISHTLSIIINPEHDMQSLVNHPPPLPAARQLGSPRLISTGAACPRVNRRLSCTCS